MLDVPQRLVEQPGHVWVEQGIGGVAAVPAAHHQPEIPQDAQLMRDRRLGHRNCVSQLADRSGALAKAAQDAHPARRRQRAHDPSHMIGRFRSDLRARGDLMPLTHRLCSHVHAHMSSAPASRVRVCVQEPVGDVSGGCFVRARSRSGTGAAPLRLWWTTGDVAYQPHHDHDPEDHGLAVHGHPLVVADQPAVTHQPPERPLHHPPAGITTNPRVSSVSSKARALLVPDNVVGGAGGHTNSVERMRPDAFRISGWRRAVCGPCPGSAW